MARVAVGLLHPEEMGSVVGEIVRAGGPQVLWASEGRSRASRAGAERAGLVDSRTLAALVRQSQVILSVCPPHAAMDVARQVAAHRFAGAYLDANAVSPKTARAIAGILEEAGTRFVGEMEESTATFAEAGLPDGFSRAAATVYRRLAGYKDSKEPPSVAEIAAALGTQ